MRSNVGLLVLALWACHGCFSGANVKGKHAKFHGCKSDDVTVQEVDSEGHTELRTIGCGHEETYYCIGMKCRSPRLLSVSEFEAEQRCKPEQIDAKVVGEMRFSVSGCGKSTLYECKQVPRAVIACSPAK